MEYNVACRIFQWNPLVYVTAGTLGRYPLLWQRDGCSLKPALNDVEAALHSVVLNLSNFFGKARPVSPLCTALQSWPADNFFARLPRWYLQSQESTWHPDLNHSVHSHFLPKVADSATIQRGQGISVALSRLYTEAISWKSFVGVLHVLTVSRWCYIPPYRLYSVLVS